MSVEGEALLSPQETEALLDAMRAGNALGEAGSVGASVAADGVELGDPERVIRRAQTSVDRRIPALALPLRRVFMRHSESGVEVTEMPSEIQPWSVVLGALDEGMAVARVRTAGGGEGLLTCSAPLVSFIVERRMGAPLPESRPGEETVASGAQVEGGAGLSWVDRRVLRPFLVDVSVELAAAFHRGRGSLHFDGFVEHPGELPTLDRYEPVLRIPVRFAPSGMAHEELALSLPAAAVLELEPPGASVVRARRRLAPTAEGGAPMRAALHGAEVEVAVVLGRMAGTIGEVLSWCRGEVLRLDSVAGRPLGVEVEGVAILEGEPTVVAGNLAVRLVRGGARAAGEGGASSPGKWSGEVEDERIEAAE